MGLYIYIAIWIINIFMALSKYKSKFISLVSIVFMGLLFCGNDGTKGDAYKYQLFFTNKNSGITMDEPGFVLYRNILYGLEITDYSVCLFGLFLLSLLFIYFGVKTTTNNSHALIALMMTFPFLSMATAIRFSVAVSISFFAIIELALKGNKLEYIGLICIATLFHLSMIICMVYLLVSDEKIRKRLYSGKGKIIIKIFVIIVLLYCLATIAMKNKLPFLQTFTTILMSTGAVNYNKIQYYFSQSTNLGYVVLYVLYFIQLFIAMMIRKKYYYSNADNVKAFDNASKLVDITYYVNLVSIIFLPLFNVTVSAFRLLMLPGFLDAISITVRLTGKGSRAFGKLEMMFMLLILAWLILLIMNINSISIEGIIEVNKWI